MNKNKRELLKILSLTGVSGTVWTKPVVDAVTLPAHATTSRCTLASGTSCFPVVYGDDEGSARINWPGGSGPYFGITFDYWDEPNQDCSGDPDDPYTSDLVVSSSIAEATILLGIEPNYGYDIGVEGCLLYEYDSTSD